MLTYGPFALFGQRSTILIRLGTKIDRSQQLFKQYVNYFSSGEKVPQGLDTNLFPPLLIAFGCFK